MSFSFADAVISGWTNTSRTRTTRASCSSAQRSCRRPDLPDGIAACAAVRTTCGATTTTRHPQSGVPMQTQCRNAPRWTAVPYDTKVLGGADGRPFVARNWPAMTAARANSRTCSRISGGAVERFRRSGSSSLRSSGSSPSDAPPALSALRGDRFRRFWCRLFPCPSRPRRAAPRGERQSGEPRTSVLRRGARQRRLESSHMAISLSAWLELMFNRSALSELVGKARMARSTVAAGSRARTARGSNPRCLSLFRRRRCSRVIFAVRS